MAGTVSNEAMTAVCAAVFCSMHRACGTAKFDDHDGTDSRPYYINLHLFDLATTCILGCIRQSTCRHVHTVG